MAHVGTITGSMTLDPSAYLAGLNRAAQATTAFRTSMTGSGMAFNQFGTNANNIAGMMGRFNTSIYASMTAFYALSRTISSSLGVFEEYSNIMSRISATADLSASSVNALSESFKKLNRELGGSRTDMMKGVYTAIQANFTRSSEFMPIGEAAMRLRTASGREIDTQKSADVISVVRNALGVRSGREGVVTDMLLRGRDIGRYQLKEMASALGIPITVFGNQFGARLGPEETLRQLIAILSSATQTGLAPRTAATGARRLVEKTTRLASAPGGVGKNLTQALGGLGYGSISEALNEGPIPYLENILKLTGGRPEELAKLGFGAREFMLLSSSLRDNMGQTRQFYQELSPGNIAGMTDKYIDKHKDTWWYQRDRLRSAYEDTQISLMQAMIPTLRSFANALELVNDLFQSLGAGLKEVIGMMAIGTGATLLKNFFFRGARGGYKLGAVGKSFGSANIDALAMGAFIGGVTSSKSNVLPSFRKQTAFEKQIQMGLPIGMMQQNFKNSIQHNAAMSMGHNARVSLLSTFGPSREGFNAYRGSFGPYSETIRNQIGLNRAIMGSMKTMMDNSSMTAKPLMNLSAAISQIGSASSYAIPVFGALGTMFSMLKGAGIVTAIGAVVEMLASILEGFSGGRRNVKKIGGETDVSRTGKDESIKLRHKIFGVGGWEATKWRLRTTGRWLSGDKNYDKESAKDLRDLMANKGLVYAGNDKWRGSTMDDVVKIALSRNFNERERAKLTNIGLDRASKNTVDSFKKWMKENYNGKTGITSERFLQSSNADGTPYSGLNLTVEWFSEFAKSLMESKEKVAALTEELNGLNQSLTVSSNGVSFFYESFLRGTQQIDTRGRLFDAMASRNQTPAERAMWSSSYYGAKMISAADELKTPVHKLSDAYNGKAPSYPYQHSPYYYMKNQTTTDVDYWRSTLNGMDEDDKISKKYDSAHRAYNRASLSEQSLPKLASLLPKLGELSTKEARAQLEKIYGSNLNLDDVGLDRLRQTDLSKYFSEKPRDQLGGKSQFMAYGETDTYNSMISMQPQEIVELQANREALNALQESLISKQEENIIEFRDLFKNQVETHLRKIESNTGKMVENSGSQEGSESYEN